ncbi:MAG: type I DNA topoisomerase [Candidatus Nealsonbacteria bacterium]|nr:type I DNA topoisomerase [Candidatus Nealsonbacteria bacterium]
MKLIIVESPTKSKTLQNFLGPKYKVLSSYGHIRDLPKGELGVDVENDFEPKYVIPTKARKNLNSLKQESQKADVTILATDEDREGEAIAWHLSQSLTLKNKKTYQRIAFHEITKPAVEEALKNPREIDMNLVNAQQARRVLDRIVGYKLSPFLWKKVARGLSAGRVQSVAVRLVVEKEREIEKFNSQEYWTIIALLKKYGEGDEAKASSSPFAIARVFEAFLIKQDEKPISKLDIKTEKEAKSIVEDLKNAKYQVINIEKKEVRKNPLPPFTTSTLQQEAWRYYKFPAKFTMRLAQRLYETGKITYHRTDSLNLSDTALIAAKKFIAENYGDNYYQFRKFKTKSKGAQEAHEAIRPTRPNFTPRNSGGQASPKDKNEEKLYDLIWRRFIGCQMKEALFNSTTADIEANKCIFRANGQSLKFDGFLKVYPKKGDESKDSSLPFANARVFEETELPALEKKEGLELIKLNPLQHFTQPPARFTEATLIKALETQGIGRPSTYAPIISTIQDRNYIEKDEKKHFLPTEIGLVVNDILVNHFPEIVDIKFTADMEEKLDEIAQGQKEWKTIMQEFYNPFSENLEKKYRDVSKKEFTEQPTKKTCPKCDGPLLVRLGKFGKFYACSKFPKCRYTESLQENALGIKCPKCKEGKVVTKRTKKNKIFYGCSLFPKCDFALWDKPVNETCPKCNSLLVEKYKKLNCSNKECNFKK